MITSGQVVIWGRKGWEIEDTLCEYPRFCDFIGHTGRKNIPPIQSAGTCVIDDYSAGLKY